MEEKKTERRKRRYWRLLVGFFGCMLLFTILSRVVDSYEVARVETALPARSPVTKTVEGTGAVEAGDLTGVPVEAGLAVGKLAAGPGVKVKAGEPLFYYDGPSMEEKRKDVLAQITGLELKIRQEQLGAVAYEGVTKAELADQALDAANRELTRQREKTGEAVRTHDENLVRLKEYYDKRLALSDEELIRQSQDDYNQSQNEYDTVQMNQEAEIQSLERKIRDTEKKIERLEGQEDADEEKLEELRDALEEYEDQLDLAEEKWDLAVIQAEDDKDRKEEIYNRSRSEITGAKLTLQETYENAVRAEEDALKAAMEAEQKAADAVAAAAQNAENARRDDNAHALTADQQKQLAELRCRDTELELSKQREILQKLDGLIAAGGMAAAPCDGTVTLSEVEQGKKLTGEERVLLSTGELVFSGAFDRDEDGVVNEGDEVSVKFEGEQASAMLTAERVDLVTDSDTGTFTARVPAGAAVLGTKGSFTCAKRTEAFNTVIPLSGLRKDITGYFCLVMQSRNAILGEKFRAERVDVKLLYSGDTAAAVEGPLMDGDLVISRSDRVVNEGDRVRPVTDTEGE